MGLAFATVNRVPTVHLEVNRNNVVPATSLPLDVWLPQPDDYASLRYRMEVLVQRILVDEVPFFKTYADVLVRHIPHKYTKEMAEVSTIVS